MNIIVLLGSPGSGRSTLGRIVARRWDIPLVSSGDLLRSSTGKLGPIARAIRHAMDRGGLVKDELVNYLLAERLESPDCLDGFVLDGCPRTKEQARHLDELLAVTHVGAQPIVLHLQVSPQAAMQRLTARLQCVGCGRVYNRTLRPPCHPGFCDDDGMPLVQRRDDEEQAIAASLKTYAETAQPVFDHYGAKCYSLDGELDPASLLERIEAIVEAKESARFAVA